MHVLNILSGHNPDTRYMKWEGVNGVLDEVFRPEYWTKIVKQKCFSSGLTFLLESKRRHVKYAIYPKICLQGT